jgi:serine-threonine kinase receptor-associated protein
MEPIVPTICPGHQKGVVELHYRTTVDGSFFISACLDYLPMLRDGNTGDWIGTFAGHKGAVWSAKINSTVTIAATGSADFTAKVWDAITGTELYSLEHKHVVKSVDISNSDSYLITGGNDKKLRVFNLKKTPMETSSLDYTHPVAVIPHSDRIRKVIWSLDDSHIYTGTEDGIVRCFSFATIKEHLLQSKNNTEFSIEPIAVVSLGEPINDMELSRSHSELLTIAAGKSIYLLQSNELKVIDQIRTNYEVETATLHGSNRDWILAGGSDMAVHAYNLGGDKQSSRQVSQLPGHHGSVHALRFMGQESRTFLSGADDATIRIWETDGAFKS